MINSLRLVSYNIHRGLSPFRKVEVLDNITDVLRSTGADILCLQEDIYSDVFTASEVEWRCRTVWKNAVYGETVLASNGSQGNTILSHFPLTRTYNIDISSATGEPRRLIGADIQLSPYQSLKIFCTHLGLFRRQRMQQSERLISYIKSYVNDDVPLILAGDFNDWKEELSQLYWRDLGLLEAHYLQHGKHGKTYPAWYPLLRLDRIYFRHLTLKNVEVIRDFRGHGRSDHLPLVADWRIASRDE